MGRVRGREARRAAAGGAIGAAPRPAGRRGDGDPDGGVTAGLIAPPVAQAFGWRPVLAAMGVVALALAVLSQGQRRTWDADRDRGAPVWAGPLDGLRAVWCSAPLRAIALAAFCFAGLYEVLGSYRTAFLLLGLLGAAGGLLALFALRRAAAAAR